MEHLQCIENSAAPEFPCATCKTPFLPSDNDDKALYETLSNHIEGMPKLTALLASTADDDSNEPSEKDSGNTRQPEPQNVSENVPLPDLSSMTGSSSELRSGTMVPNQVAPPPPLPTEPLPNSEIDAPPEVTTSPPRPASRPSRPIPPAVPTTPMTSTSASGVTNFSPSGASSVAPVRPSLPIPTSHTDGIRKAGPIQATNSSGAIDTLSRSTSEAVSETSLEALPPNPHPSQNEGTSRTSPTDNFVRSRAPANSSAPREHSIDMGHDPQDKLAPKNPGLSAGPKHGRSRGDERVLGMKGRRTGTAGGKSVTVRKLLKKGDRTVREVRQLLTGYTKQITVGVIFMMCIILILALSSGDDDTLSNADVKHVDSSDSRVRLQDFSLPHVRVNPALSHHEHPVRAPRAVIPRGHHLEDDLEDDIVEENEIMHKRDWEAEA